MSDERNDANEMASGGAVPPNFSEMLDKVLANPEIISTVASALSKSGEQTVAQNGETADKEERVETAETAQTAVNEPSSPDVAAMMQKLPDVMKLVGPMMSKGGGKSVSSRANDKRACLLNAIKPYLNPHRCEAIDYMIRFSELSELIKKIH